MAELVSRLLMEVCKSVSRGGGCWLLRLELRVSRRAGGWYHGAREVLFSIPNRLPRDLWITYTSGPSPSAASSSATPRPSGAPPAGRPRPLVEQRRDGVGERVAVHGGRQGVPLIATAEGEFDVVASTIAIAVRQRDRRSEKAALPAGNAGLQTGTAARRAAKRVLLIRVKRARQRSAGLRPAWSPVGRRTAHC